MSYALVEVDILRSLEPVQLSDTDSGVALIVRRGGRPVGFVMEPCTPGTLMSVDDIDALAGRAAADILHEALLDELGRPALGPGPSITVAICTHGRPELVRRCLTHLVARSEGIEILVVDNAPPDDLTAREVSRFPDARYVREPLPGLDFARNRALAEATSEVVAFLDDDVVVEDGWLAGLREAWAMHPDAGAVTGLVLPYALRTEAQVLFELYGGFRRGFRMIRYQGPVLRGNPLFPYGAGMFGAGCNMSVRRQLALGLGGFDEALDTGAPLPGGGDLDMFHRVLRSGTPLVYAPAAAVRHEHRTERVALRRQLYTWGTGHMAYVAKTYQRDPEGRSVLRRLVAWQLRRQTREAVDGLLGRGPLPRDLAIAQLHGSLVGLMGGYRRSVRRTTALRGTT